MKAKKFLVILSLLAVALFVVACDCDGEDTTTPTTDPVVTTTEATTTKATTTEATTTAATTVATTTKITTKVTTTVTTTATTPAPVVPNDPYLWNGNVAVAFAGGTGTAEDPYQIANGAQLALMAETFEKGAYYILVDDIMLNDVYNYASWDSITTLLPLNEWEPIEGFNANFDGKGKTIYGLFGTPLFATTKDASITNFAIAYTNVKGAVLAGTATDTNIAGITIDKATLKLDGKTDITWADNATIDDIMAATGTKWLVTLGDNPDVWTFEGLAVGALATDLFVANDKLGTSFNVAIVDGKGYVETETDGKKALAWDANDKNGNTLVLNIAKDNTALTNWSGADEVLVYVDGSEQAGAYKFGISLVDVAGKTWTLAKDMEVSTLDGKAWSFFKSTGANFELADGYKGWVRIPFAAFTDGAEGKIDTANFNVAQIAFYYENASAVDAGNFYIDSVKILDANGAWKVLPNTIPNLAPAYGITVLEDFSAPVEGDAWVKAGQEANINASIADGKYTVNVPGGFADTYFKVGANVPSDTKGFLIYLDTDIVEKLTDKKGGWLSGNLSFKIAFRLQIDGKYYAIGANRYSSEANINMNFAWAQCDDGNWTRIANTNNNRMNLPQDDFTGWLFLPVENLSDVTYPSFNSNRDFLDDYLATKTDAKMTQVEIYYADGNKGSSLSVDNVIAVSGTSTKLTLDAPATLPGSGVAYNVNQTLDFDDDLFFKPGTKEEMPFDDPATAEKGAAIDFEKMKEYGSAAQHNNYVAGKGVDGSDAIGLTTNASGAAEAKTPLRAGFGETLTITLNDTGIMMWVDLSGVTVKEGATDIGLRIRMLMERYAHGIRSDYNPVNADGGNYWTHHLIKEVGMRSGYIVGEDGKWTKVTNDANSDGTYMSLPAGYTGYLYIPLTEFGRNGASNIDNSDGKFNKNSNIYNSTEGIVNGYIFLRSLGLDIINANEGETMYIDNFSIIEGTPVVEQVVSDKAPAKLPDGTTYELYEKIGFEDQGEFALIFGSASDYYFSTDRAVCGNAISLSPRRDGQQHIQAYIRPDKAINLKGSGVKGVMLYVDLTQIADEDDGDGFIGVTVTINSNDHRTKNGSGWYLKNGTTEWVETKPISDGNDRQALPVGFAGWLYFPIESYTGAAADQCITYLRLYTTGYKYETGKYLTFDELMYIK